MVKLLTAALFSVTLFAAMLFYWEIPKHIQIGNQAQDAIQLLDAMRPPMLAVVGLENASAESPSTAKLALLISQIEQHVDTYLAAAEYNEALYKDIKLFYQVTQDWLVQEKELWQHRIKIQNRNVSKAELVQFKIQHDETIASFLYALEVLALGEKPIHHDIDLGQLANKRLLIISILLVLYLLLLVILFQHFSRKALQTALKETKQASITLAQREQYLALTLNSIGDAVITTDVFGNVTRMNPVAIELTGWSLEDAQGRSLKIIFPIVDATTRKEIDNPVDKVIATGETIYLSNHTTLISKDGSEYQIADSAAPIHDADNNISGMVLVFNDVTEQYHLREERLRYAQLLADSQRMAQIGSWEFDLQSKQFKWSDEIYRIFEVSPEEIDCSYDSLINIRHPEDRERVLHTYAEAVNNKTPYNSVHRIQLANGHIKYVQEHGETIYGENGEAIRSTGIIQDITARVETEEALRRSQKMDAIGQLSGGIAHDFNNQLGVVIGYLDFLSELFTKDDKAYKWINTASKATLRCMDLTRQLLSFSRHHAKDKVATDINASIEEMKIIISRSVTPEIEVSYTLADNLGKAETNPAELQDTLLNLTINARDAMPKGGKLHIETRNKYLDSAYCLLNPNVKPGDYIEISISDNGTGMDEKTLEHIFEPFFTTKPKDKGTGLGMAMVYSFVKRYNGHIKLNSQVNIGSNIHLYLPLCESAECKTDIKDEVKQVLPVGNESILIVDDEEDLLQLTEKILSNLGYQTQTANNAAQALEIIKSDSNINLLFSDVIMPGDMNGYELAEMVSEIKPEIKILLTSGFTSKAISHGKLEKFSANLLHKPYRKNNLAQRIRLVLDSETNNNE